MPALRAAGITPLVGNLDLPASLQRLAGLATRVIYLAPPPAQGRIDPRLLAMTQVLRLRGRARSWVYASTSGVYGDCAGAKVNETCSVQPHTPRAQRRANAEVAARHFGLAGQVRTSILRVPGIYAHDREAGTPRERLLKGTPVLRSEDDVYTNHIHADDLARACLLALWRGATQRVINICDYSEMKMGDYFDLAADCLQLPRPPRVPRNLAADQLPLMLLSFMGESRRLDNRRMAKELRLTLRYPQVADGLKMA